MTDQPIEPRRVVHEVCRLASAATQRRWRIGTSADEDEDDSLIRLDEEGVVVVASVVLFEHETYDPPPWIRHGLQTKGWWIRQRKLPPTGLATHGAVDWQVIAEKMAEAMRKRKTPTKAEKDALQDFDIAQAEISLAGLPAEGQDT